MVFNYNNGKSGRIDRRYFNIFPISLYIKPLMTKGIILFLIAVLPFGTVLSQIMPDFRMLTTTVRQYEKAEWNIDINESYKNPFDSREVSLDMIITSPSGKPLVLPCYYDTVQAAETLWKARFAPQEAGKYSFFFRLAAHNATSYSRTGIFISAPSDKPGFLHKNDLWTFKFDNGAVFRGIGENIGWESRSFEDSLWTYDYLLTKLAANKGNFFRTWLCSWNLPLEWKKVSSTRRYSNSNQYFNPGAVKRMDELVNICDSLGLYFMLTIDWHGALIPDAQWRTSNYNSANGGPATNPTEFFTLRTSREQYKNRLRYLVARWGYSTSIAAWEFFNEIDNAAFTQQDSIRIPHDAVTQWHMEMSRYLKDVDPYGHLVTTSISHRDIEGLNSIAYIDFNQKHIYKHTERIPEIYNRYIETFGKPYVVAEFGYRWEDDDSSYGKLFDYDFKRGLWYGLFSPTPVLPMSWWWELFDKRNMTSYFRSVRLISDEMLKAGNGSFVPFSLSAGLLESHGVRCGNEYFVYLLNNSDTAISVPVTFAVEAADRAAIQSFTPEDMSFKKMDNFGSSTGSITINIELDSKKELVLIVNK